jgi:hypothetical protein
MQNLTSDIVTQISQLAGIDSEFKEALLEPLRKQKVETIKFVGWATEGPIDANAGVIPVEMLSPKLFIPAMKFIKNCLSLPKTEVSGDDKFLFKLNETSDSISVPAGDFDLKQKVLETMKRFSPMPMKVFKTQMEGEYEEDVPMFDSICVNPIRGGDFWQVSANFENSMDMAEEAFEKYWTNTKVFMPPEPTDQNYEFVITREGLWLPYLMEDEGYRSTLEHFRKQVILVFVYVFAREIYPEFE